MPNIKSAKKRVKVAAAKTAQNKVLTSAMRTEIKKANAAIENNTEGKQEAVRVAIKKIDKAATGLVQESDSGPALCFFNDIFLHSFVQIFGNIIDIFEIIVYNQFMEIN